MQLAQSIKTLAAPPAVVFVTAHAGHAVQAFELEVVDYLTKPVRLERLQAALQKAERLAQITRTSVPDAADDVVVIHDRGRKEQVPLSEVLYLKAELKYYRPEPVTRVSAPKFRTPARIRKTK